MNLVYAKIYKRTIIIVHYLVVSDSKSISWKLYFHQPLINLRSSIKNEKKNMFNIMVYKLFYDVWFELRCNYQIETCLTKQNIHGFCQVFMFSFFTY